MLAWRVLSLSVSLSLFRCPFTVCVVLLLSPRVVASMLNKDLDSAEKYIVGVIRDGHLDGRIDSIEGHLVITPPESKVYVP